MKPIYIVDAFTRTPFKGNPAAVMLVDEFPTEMQLIAREMNLSETAFVKPLAPDCFHIRWMTPTTEVKLCGHATLAASHIIFTQQYSVSTTIRFNSLSGELLVQRSSDGYILDFPLQKIGEPLDPALFNAVLNHEQIQEVVQAYDDVIVLLKSEEDLVNFAPNYQELVKIDVRGIIVTAPSTRYDFVSRFFAPRVGVNEDPVTGSAHCKLAHFWSQKLNKTKFHAYQASQRGGELFLEIIDDRVLITGHAVTFLEGQVRSG